jgi:hypothetical protein
MNTYFYTHIISYYINNNRPENIYTAIEKLNNYNLTKLSITNKNLLLICIIYDNIDEQIKIQFDKIILSQTSKLDIKVFYRYNTGGTIQTMDYAYNYIIHNNITSKYVGIWEDDTIFANICILDIVEEKLNEGNILVGRVDKENIEFKTIYPVNKNRLVPYCFKYHIYENDTGNQEIPYESYKWLDGSGYLTTLTNLTIIKSKLNRFTLAPENMRYTHCEHGINYGEVGFCVRLHVNGFKFVGLFSNIYHEMLDIKTIGNKLE